MRIMKNIALIIFLFYSLIVSAENIYDYKYQGEIKDASIITLLDSERIDIKDSGEYIKSKRVVKKILNYKGKKDHSEFKIYYDTRYETLKINSAKTVKKDGDTYIAIEVKEEAIKYMDAPFESGHMSYAVHKLCVVAFPSVEEGDIVDIDYTIENNKKDKFTDMIIWNESEPVVEKIYEVISSKEIKINSFNKESAGLKESKEEKGYILKAENLEKVYTESNRAKVSYFKAVTYISEYKSWNDYGALLNEDFGSATVLDENIKNTVKNISGDKEKIEDKLEAVKDYIAKNIEDKPVYSLLNFKARTAKEILDSSYADSKDRAVLFITMLKELGVKAYPVAVGSEKEYFDNIEAAVYTDDLYYFLVKFNINNKDYYVDCVSEFYNIGENSYYKNRGLLISDSSEIVEVDTINKDSSIIKYNIKIDSSGGAYIRYEEISKGETAAAERVKYTYMTPRDKKQDYEKIISSISQNAKGIDWGIEFEKDRVKKYYEFYYKDFIVKDGDFVYFDCFTDLQPLFLSIEPKDRRYPYAKFMNSKIRKEVEIELYDEFEFLILPENMEVITDIFNVKREVEKSSKVIKIIDTTVYRSAIINRGDYKETFEKTISLSKPVYNKILMKTK